MSEIPLPTRPFSALLFDMDGTIISSIASAERVWSRWAEAHGLDVASFLPTIHGVQSVETIRRLNLPGVDPEAEAAAITRAEMDDVGDITEIAGARAFLKALPPERWAIVTSAPRALATRRLAAAGMPLPALMVAAEDVRHGKPAPDCFLMAAERLGVAAPECLVFEDAPAGIQAAEAAGATVLVVTATHHRPVSAGHAAFPDYRGLSVEAAADGIRVIART
ncbi:Hexitol phosphatase A [Methylobacterium tardum]|uniref:Glycerol-3-phosphatase n=1 Tax=Methylobacterium tardum TaxID=374432 RepID=A0AA37TKE5_9HYPH|nr:HAD-IA family hydrolase [Methylobacterium tardum]URD36803.1 HAD-IA family hydrolase [Methylobacterium tardum]GJE47227.1 Hexitol phosphatase A [Methylobacterium tardum]GLS71401.1 glycerol-3-phosphatase [Methylobacterium tardum]